MTADAMGTQGLPLEYLLWASLHPRAEALGQELDELLEAWGAGQLGAGRRAGAEAILDHPGGPLVPFTLPGPQRRCACLMVAAFLELAPPGAEAVVHSHGALAGMGHLRFRRTGQAEFLERAPESGKAARLVLDPRALERSLAPGSADPMTARLVPEATGILLRIQLPAVTRAWPGDPVFRLDPLDPPGRPGSGRERPPLLLGRRRPDAPRTIEFRITRPEQILRICALAEAGQVLVFSAARPMGSRDEDLGLVRLAAIQNEGSPLACAERLPARPWPEALALDLGVVLATPTRLVQRLGQAIGWWAPLWDRPRVAACLEHDSIPSRHQEVP